MELINDNDTTGMKSVVLLIVIWAGSFAPDVLPLASVSELIPLSVTVDNLEVIDLVASILGHVCAYLSFGIFLLINRKKIRDGVRWISGAAKKAKEEDTTGGDAN